MNRQRAFLQRNQHGRSLAVMFQVTAERPQSVIDFCLSLTAFLHMHDWKHIKTYTYRNAQASEDPQEEGHIVVACNPNTPAGERLVTSFNWALQWSNLAAVKHRGPGIKDISGIGLRFWWGKYSGEGQRAVSPKDYISVHGSQSNARQTEQEIVSLSPKTHKRKREM